MEHIDSGVSSASFDALQEEQAAYADQATDAREEALVQLRSAVVQNTIVPIMVLDFSPLIIGHNRSVLQSDRYVPLHPFSSMVDMRETEASPSPPPSELRILTLLTPGSGVPLYELQSDVRSLQCALEIEMLSFVKLFDIHCVHSADVSADDARVYVSAATDSSHNTITEPHSMLMVTSQFKRRLMPMLSSAAIAILDPTGLKSIESFFNPRIVSKFGWNMPDPMKAIIDDTERTLADIEIPELSVGNIILNSGKQGKRPANTFNSFIKCLVLTSLLAYCHYSVMSKHLHWIRLGWALKEARLLAAVLREVDPNTGGLVIAQTQADAKKRWLILQKCCPSLSPQDLDDWCEWFTVDRERFNAQTIRRMIDSARSIMKDDCSSDREIVELVASILAKNECCDE